ncbi:hypothetical protein [Kribbella monticola]|uniref:hypothetical protein n=1 Tax=Kribbella monticola TaxID=2185285 RepID=UPI000DD3A169|nr:hypothetical protein [Kribbella monticola]
MKKSLAGSAILLTLVLAGGPAVTAAQASVSSVAAAPAAVQTLSPEQTSALAAKLNALRPTDGSTLAAKVQAQVAIDDDLSAAVIPTACNPSTPVRDWAAAQRSDWTAADLQLADAINSFQPLLLDVLLWPQDAGSNFGLSGEFNTDVNHTFRDLGRFWDIDPAGIRLEPMKGTMLTDQARMFRLFNVAYGFPAATATALATEVVTAMNQEKFDHGNHPYFSFNAFAYPGTVIPGFVIPKMIVMGDGVLEAFKAIGYSDVTAQAILAHEYGHHVQFQRNLFQSDLTGPEASRRTELMADSFAAYFLTHARGDALQYKRIQQFDQVFFQLGDCGFTNPSHHGTHAQRLRAADWGYSVVQNSPDQGHILPSLTFANLFEAELPVIVA